jgi:hypothetical protein
MSFFAGRLPVDEHGRIRDDVPARPFACAPPSPRVTRERPATVRPASVLWREFVAEVAPLHGVDPVDVLSSRRTAAIALARRHSWFEIRDRTPLSWPEIGRASGVHHTTAMTQAKKFSREAGMPDWRG